MYATIHAQMTFRVRIFFYFIFGIKGTSRRRREREERFKVSIMSDWKLHERPRRLGDINQCFIKAISIGGAFL